MDVKKQKKLMRAEARARRAEAHSRQAGATERALGHFQDAIGFPNGAVVSGYLPVDDEFDVVPFLAAANQHGCATGLPFVPGKAEPLVFRAWAPGDPLVDGALNIPVPPDDAPVVAPTLLLVPMLAFDSVGYRLGYGGGFYDRTLSLLKASNSSTLAVGVAYAAQRVDAVPRNHFDQPLDWIVTEEGATAFERA
ncbi:MAG: 5-formyltetrahydrofolate cyclo-ligase [Pseudomonadota bacterium]